MRGGSRAASILLAATMLDIADGRIVALHTIVNPDKLAYLARRVSPPA